MRHERVKGHDSPAQVEEPDDTFQGTAIPQIGRCSASPNHDETREAEECLAVLFAWVLQDNAKRLQAQRHVEVGAVEIVAVSFGSSIRQVQGRQGQDAMHEELVGIGNLRHFHLPDIADGFPI